MSKMSEKIIIGLTGNIASGKSTVSNYLSQQGYKIVDTDKITAQLYTSNETFKTKLVNLFGNSILENNQINKTKVAQLVFNNKELLKKLEEIAYPMIIEQSLAIMNNTLEKIIIFDVPQLFEAGFDKYCDYIILVYIDPKIQLERLMSRNNFDYEYAMKRINSQIPQDKKIEKANYVIDNSKDLNSLYQQVDEILKQIERK